MSLRSAQEFARLIDHQSFEEASNLIAEDCNYHYTEGNYQGRKPIISIYRQNYLQSQKIFDELLCSSTVDEVSESTYKINFTDKIRKGPQWHTYHFYEILECKDDLIIDIQNCQISGEDESLRSFFITSRNLLKGAI